MTHRVYVPHAGWLSALPGKARWKAGNPRTHNIGAAAAQHLTLSSADQFAAIGQCLDTFRKRMTPRICPTSSAISSRWLSVAPTSLDDCGWAWHDSRPAELSILPVGCLQMEHHAWPGQQRLLHHRQPAASTRIRLSDPPTVSFTVPGGWWCRYVNAPTPDGTGPSFPACPAASMSRIAVLRHSVSGRGLLPDAMESSGPSATIRRR